MEQPQPVSFLVGSVLCWCEIWAGPLLSGLKPRFRASNFAVPYPDVFFGFPFSGEVEQQRTPATTNLLSGAEGEEVERRKETMELFPQSVGFSIKDAAAPRCVPLLLHII